MADSGWTSHTALTAAANSLRSSNVRDAPLELVRFGSNAIFRLGATDVLLRVAPPQTSRGDAERSVTLAGVLLAAGLQVPSPVDLWESSAICDAEVAGASAVTAWSWIRADPEPLSAGEFGAALRRLHGATLDLPLPTWDPVMGLIERWESVRLLALPDWMIKTVDAEVAGAAADLQRLPASHLGVGPIHGDAHMGNVIRAQKQAILLDLDDFCVGPREVDLAPTLVAARRLRLSSDAWREFSDAYGFDLAASDEIAEPLCRARQLTMTTWLMLQWGQSDEVNEEIELRVRTLAE